MGFSLDVSVPVFTVFLQGLLSFFSPCVLPLIPLYIGYLSGGTKTVHADGHISYNRRKVLLHTLFFVLGVSFTFFLLGFGFSALGAFFKSNQMLFARIGGILIIVFGVYQLGIFGKSKVLEQEHRLPFRLNALAMSPLTALLMGFTFSFAWTPCVGPALASVLLMAASAATKAMGFLLIGVYTLGFILPFLAVGFFTSSLLELLKKHRNVVKYTIRAGAVLMILMGLMMFTGKMNAVTGYLSGLSAGNPQNTDSKEETPDAGPGTTDSAKSDPDPDSTRQNEDELPDLIDFTLTDQYGKTHTLSAYQGKTVFLNFWATWCKPCRAEMPAIQKIYESYQANGDDSVVILGIAAPNYGGEKTVDGIAGFLAQNGYTYPVLMDVKGQIFQKYGVYSYPTTFMITKDGKIFGYASGQLNESTMRRIIEQTLQGKR